jgi:hypothetical protein
VKTKLAEARKTLVAVLGVVAQAVSLGVLHGAALHGAQVVLAVATAAGVWAAPNGTASDYQARH